MSERGSTAWVNSIFTETMEHVTELIKTVYKPLLDSKRPPLTEEVTLADLKKMGPGQAEYYLRMELRRTMQTDEAGKDHIDPDTLRLIAEWYESQRESVDEYAM